MISFTLADAYLHTMDPFAIEFPRSWPLGGVRWYGLAYAAGFVFGWLALKWMAKTRRSELEPQQVGDVMFYAIFGVLLGGRIGYALFYEPQLFVGFTSDVPWWDLLAINKGGMASHGGILGFIIAMMLYARRNKLSSLHLLDMGSIFASIGLFLGRLANFVNAELWGKRLPDEMQTNVPNGTSAHVGGPWWSVKYPSEIFGWPASKLFELTDVVREVGVSEQQWGEMISGAAPLLSGGERTQGAIDAWNEIQRTLTEVVDRIQHHDEAVLEAFQPFVADLTAYYPSQLIQALTDGPILFAALALVWFGPRKPGVVGAWFLMVYGVLRIVSELFRQPDDGVAVILGLQRGQLLSVGMILGGAIGLWIVSRRDVGKFGGLVRVRSGNQGGPAPTQTN